MINVMTAGALAGFIAGALTNPFQFMAVQFQTNPGKKWYYFVEKYGFRNIFLRGIGLRTIHHSLFSLIFFYLFA